jgi:D-serine deaminase-like pyridoxal phosphate-dependent protein
MNPQTKTPLSDALRALVGQGVGAIDTPALVLDLDAMKRNLGRMAEFAKKHDIRWRPHAKMHKSSALAKLQVQAGAVGVCVQKTAK